jgi:nitric oxide dioxygenase
MNSREVQLVQSSFEVIAIDADRFSESFYDQLFAIDPTLRALFPEDLTEQRKKLMQILAVAVQGLDRLEQLIPAVRSLGERHVGYGVLPEHYDTVATAFLPTLAKALGPTFTDDVKNAWIAAYQTLTAVMLDAAAAVSAGKVA